jgi:hypothetical protein
MVPRGAGGCSVFFGDCSSACCKAGQSHLRGHPSPTLGFWWKGVPGVHIRAHIGKTPHHSPSSARQSLPRYWAQLVQDNCSGLPLDKTETMRRMNKPSESRWQEVKGIAHCKRGKRTSRPVLPNFFTPSTQGKLGCLHSIESGHQTKAPWVREVSSWGLLGSCPLTELRAREPGLASDPQASLLELLPCPSCHLLSTFLLLLNS